MTLTAEVELIVKDDFDPRSFGSRPGDRSSGHFYIDWPRALPVRRVNVCRGERHAQLQQLQLVEHRYWSRRPCNCHLGRLSC